MTGNPNVPLGPHCMSSQPGTQRNMNSYWLGERALLASPLKAFLKILRVNDQMHPSGLS